MRKEKIEVKAEAAIEIEKREEIGGKKETLEMKGDMIEEMTEERTEEMIEEMIEEMKEVVDMKIEEKTLGDREMRGKSSVILEEGLLGEVQEMTGMIIEIEGEEIPPEKVIKVTEEKMIAGSHHE